MNQASIQSIQTGSLMILILILAAPVSAVDFALSRSDWRKLAETPVGSSTRLAVDVAKSDSPTPMSFERIEIYAHDARIQSMTPDGPRDIPRSSWLHFIGEDQAKGWRMSLSVAADGSQATGYEVAADGEFPIAGQLNRKSGTLGIRRKERVDRDGAPLVWSCADGNLLPDASTVDHSVYFATAKSPVPSPTAANLKALLGGSHSATIAVETDNEFLAAKFGGNQTNATTYIAALFAAMHVIYERDINLSILQGNTTFWPSGSPDPYSEPADTCFTTQAQLNEFGNFWQANRGGVPRAFAMMLSGKSTINNCASGRAWLTGASNMCSATSGNGGHYSFNNVFKNEQQSAANDVGVVAHEIGHNFGANHTHCTDRTTGAEPVSSNTVDQCFNGESGFGCYGGATSCPAASTVNGVANVRGTLMSYCADPSLGACSLSNVFADIHRTNLTTVKNNNVTSGCFPPVGGGGTFSINDASIGEGNAGTQNLAFTISRSSSVGAAAVTVNTQNVSATSGSDYTAISNQVINFANGTASQPVNVTIQGDTTVEPNETFNVLLSNPTGGFTIADGTGVGTITNDDVALPSLTVNDPSVTEGNSGTRNLTYTLTLSATSAQAVSVTVQSANGTATTGNNDYVALNSTANIAIGQLTTTVNVTVNGDTTGEPDETVLLNLTNPVNATIADNQGMGTILDDDNRIFMNGFE